MDIFEKLKQLNIPLQGKIVLKLVLINEIRDIQKKLLFFESQLKNNNVQHFPLLRELKNSKYKKIYSYAKINKKNV